jgi:hypothetical protein
MNATRKTTTKRLIASLGVAAAGAVTPALLYLGAGTAHADDCYGELAYSYYCSPASGALNPEPVAPVYTPPSPNLWAALPQCTGGVLEALDGEC